MSEKKKKAGLLKMGLLAGLLAGGACIFKALSGKKETAFKKKKKV